MITKRFNKYFLILAILAPLLVAGLASSILKRATLLAELRTLREEVGRLSSKNEELQSFIRYFSLQANLEREAKTSLNLAKPGEVLVIFVSPSPSPSLNINPVENISLFQRFLKWIKK